MGTFHRTFTLTVAANSWGTVAECSSVTEHLRDFHEHSWMFSVSWDSTVTTDIGAKYEKKLLSGFRDICGQSATSIWPLKIFKIRYLENGSTDWVEILPGCRDPHCLQTAEIRKPYLGNALRYTRLKVKSFSGISQKPNDQTQWNFTTW